MIHHKSISLLLFLFLIACANLSAQTPKAESWVNYVDPLIGTGQAQTESAKTHSGGTELKGQTYPAVGVPFGMTHWTPQTRTTEVKCVSPYYYADTKISGFRGSHWMSGSCTQDYGSVTIMPTTGPLQIDPVKYASTFSHSTEKATPASYTITLNDYNITANITAASRAGLLNFKFNKENSEAPIIIYPNSDEGEAYVKINAAANEVIGVNPVHRIYQGSGKPAGFSGFFVIKFSKSFKTYGTFRDGKISEMESEAKGEKKQAGAYIKYAVKAGEIIQVKVGTSFTSLEEARRNLEAEIIGWNFEKVRLAAVAAWNKALGTVQVNGDAHKKTIFYTALYHGMQLPRVYSDVSGAYPVFATQYQTATAKGFEYHGDFSLWDTYRAVHPLYNLLLPEKSRNMVSTLITMAEQGGWLPNFPCWNNYTSAMIGDHATSVITDAYVKGIWGFNAEKGYFYMRKNALEIPEKDQYKDGRGRRALSSYLKYNYYPLEDSIWDAYHKREQVSRTLEYAYNDFTIAQLAKALGKTDDYKLFSQRGQNYKNVFDAETGYMRGRFANGTWSPVNKPNKKVDFITEGTPWQYTYSVQQDVPGLIKLMGGNEKFVQRLDAFFDQKEYWHGNEHAHHVAYLYTYAGAPWKTQQRIKEIAATEYSTGPGGISGNDDTGQTSAWYAFTAMGFYPVTPGTPYYILGAPIFSEVVIKSAANKLFIISAKNASEANHYIQSAKLNGKPYDKIYLSHMDIMKGGKLELEMGDKPNKERANKLPILP